MERERFALMMAALRGLPEAKRRPAKARYTHTQVLAVWLWAVLHDRPISWATQRANWPWHDRTRPLPSDATMSRRLRDPAVVALIQAWVLAMSAAAAADDDPTQPLILDGKPLPVSGHSADADVGVGRTTAALGRGYKLHAIVGVSGRVHDFLVEPLSVREQAAAATLLQRRPPAPPTRELLADANYDSNRLYDLAAEHGLYLRTPRRYRHAKALGHHRHSPHRLATIRLIDQHPEVLTPRRRIEGHFGTMGNVAAGLAPLPNHVRRLHRVRRWVAGKLLIDAAHRQRRQANKAA